MPEYTLQNIKARIENLNLDRQFPARGSGYTGYTAKTLTFWHLSTTDQAAYLKNNSGMPLALSGDFGRHAEDLLAAHQMLKDEWSASFTAGIQETFGRTPEVGDYKVSGIGRDEFSLPRKTELRKLVRMEAKVASLAIACKLATGCRPATAFDWFRAGCVSKTEPLSQLAAETDAEEIEAQAVDRPRG